MAAEPTITDDPYGLAVNYWRSQSVPLLPAATSDEIEIAFAQLNRPFSDDVRRLYSATGGFADYESDHLWSFWSLDRLVRENQGRDSDYLWFADWLISSHMYAFRYISPAVSAVFIDHNSSEHPPTQIAEGVAVFLRKYVDDPNNVEAWNLDN